MAERTRLTTYRNSDKRVTYSFPAGYNLDGFAPIFYFRAGPGDAPTLTVQSIATPNGSNAVVVGDSVVLTLKADDLATFGVAGTYSGVYDSNMPKSGFVNKFVGGPHVQYVDGSYGEEAFTDSVLVEVMGVEVPIILEGGNIGAAAAVAVKEAVEAADSAAQSASTAQTAAATAVAATINKADLNGSNILGANQAAFRGAIGADLAGNVNFLQNGTGAVSRTVQTVLRDAINVKDFGAVGDGSTDDGPAIRLAQTAAITLGRPLHIPTSSGPYVIGPDPAAPLAAGFRTYSLKINSNTTWVVEGKLKAANGSTSWNRIVTLQGATNVTILGSLDVDANVQNASVTTNEHMHGVYLFDTTNTYIQHIRSVNSRGDNVIIAGTDNTRGSNGVIIGSISASVAGRKNLVLTNFDNVHIGECDLDNSAGGAAIYTGGVPDDTDKHSFDVEPDGYLGANRMEAFIGSMRTNGTGNDFTAGITEALGEKVIVNIGTLAARKSVSSTVKAHIQNAITLNIGTYSLTGLAGAQSDVTIFYGARLNVGRWEVSGAAASGSDNLIEISGIATDYPRVHVDYFDLKCTAGLAALRWGNGARGYVGELRLRAPVNLPIRHVGTGASGVSGSVTYGKIDAENSGDVNLNNVLLAVSASAGETPHVSIEEMAVRDSRGSPTTRAVLLDTGMSVGLTFKNLKTRLAMNPVAWVGADTFYSRMGLDGGPRDYVCNGTPEALIAAPIGSSAWRLDGSTSTTLYVKTSGTGNTGWTAK